MSAGEIEEMVHRETRAWDARDAESLLALFHPDMVWAWPPGPDDHDPLSWVLELGRFDRKRWGDIWRSLFATYDLVHNRRTIRRIALTSEGDGALAVVDVDTLWRGATGTDFHWLGRACKVYTRTGGEWKMIGHTGLLRYPER